MKLNPLSLLVLMVALAGVARAAEPDILTVAVFDFESKDEGVRDLGAKAAALITANLSAQPNIITVERAELEKLLGEQELGLSGTVSGESAAKVGHLTGAKVLVTGRVFKVDNETIMVAKIIGTETSRVYGDTVSGGASSSLNELSTQLAKKIASIVTEKGATLVAKFESRDDHIARIIKTLKDDKRPSVSIKIPEHHFGQAVVDPAAETELAFILQKAGFTIVDDKSSQKPDLVITGDAFSAYALRKGNLISCRSRIEIKVLQREGEKIITQDSQTSVAVDIAEQTAAKTSLQNAADELVERLLPKLTQ